MDDGSRFHPSCTPCTLCASNALFPQVPVYLQASLDFCCPSISPVCRRNARERRSSSSSSSGPLPSLPYRSSRRHILEWNRRWNLVLRTCMALRITKRPTPTSGPHRRPFDCSNEAKSTPIAAGTRRSEEREEGKSNWRVSGGARSRSRNGRSHPARRARLARGQGARDGRLHDSGEPATQCSGKETPRACRPVAPVSSPDVWAPPPLYPQDFAPVKQICAHLNAFHAYADDPTRCVEANHYCSHVNEGM